MRSFNDKEWHTVVTDKHGEKRTWFAHSACHGVPNNGDLAMYVRHMYINLLIVLGGWEEIGYANGMHMKKTMWRLSVFDNSKNKQVFFKEGCGVVREIANEVIDLGDLMLSGNL